MKHSQYILSPFLPWFIGGLLIIVSSCSGQKEEVASILSTPEPGFTDSDWSVPKDQVFDAGPGKDGIPALENPYFVLADEATYLGDEDLIIGYKSGDDIRAYPHAILDWHEIVNDEINGDKVAITYCPLTGTGIGWNRVIDGRESTFGVSGLLYNTNLMPYDRATNSIWSQILNASVHGTLQDEKIGLFPLVETSWENWKSMYPETTVLSDNTGYARNYGNYPYGSYKWIENVLFPISTKDERIFAKERVLGVVMEWGTKVYRFEHIDSDASGKVNVILDSFGPQGLIVVGNKDFMVAYKITGVKGAMDFIPLQGELPLVFKDNLGNKYDVFGVVQKGTNLGERLEPVAAFMGYFFSFGTFYPVPEIFE